MQEVNTREDVVERASRDPEFLNSLLSGSYAEPAQEEVVEAPVSDEPASTEPQAPVEPDDSNRRYIEWKEQELEREKQRIREQELRYKEMVEREKQARLELEKKLEELKQKPTESPFPVAVTSDDEDDEYASDYAKQTRQMVKELNKALEGVKSSEVGELKKELLRIKELEERRAKEYEEAQQRQEEEYRQKKLIKDLDSFTSKYPELKMSDSIENLNREWMGFRKNILNITGATSPKELEHYIDDYVKGGKTKELADSHGIPFVKDYDKLMTVYELLDMKRGIKYNKELGVEEPILDDENKPVRYRTIEEAYKLSKYYDELNQARLSSMKDVQQKLRQRSQAAVTLNETETSSFDTGLSKADISRLIKMDPKQYKNNPELRQQVEAVYRSIGMEPPRI
jgi:hypothetical protein